MIYQTTLIDNHETKGVTRQDAEQTQKYIAACYLAFNTHPGENAQLYAERTMHDVDRILAKGKKLLIPLNKITTMIVENDPL